MSLLRNFLSRLMQNRHQVMLFGAAFALMTSMLKPFTWIVAGIISLVTLSQGVKEGFYLLALSLGLIFFGLFVLEQLDLFSFFFMSTALIPVWLLATLFRAYPSHYLQLKAAMLCAFILIAMVYLSVSDIENWKITQFWRMYNLDVNNIPPEIKHTEFADIPKSSNFIGMTLSFIMLAIWLGTNYLGRWWQSILYHPGGFAKEFHQLSINRELAIPTVLCTLIIMNFGGLTHDIAADMITPILAVYWLGGVALFHFFFGHLQIHWIFVMLFYVLSIVPHILILIMGLGILDSFVNIRAIYKRYNPMD